MALLTNRDFWISGLIGFIAGLMALPSLYNIGIVRDPALMPAAVTLIATLPVMNFVFFYWIHHWMPSVLQFSKFSIVGGLNALIDLGVLNFLIAFSGIASGLLFSLFKSSSFVIAVINSYLWNKFWTFESRERVHRSEFTRFVLINIVGLGINVGVASFIVNGIGAPVGMSAPIWANIGAFIAALTGVMWNYLGVKHWVFRK